MAHPDFNLEHVEAGTIAWLEQDVEDRGALRLHVVHQQPRRSACAEHAMAAVRPRVGRHVRDREDGHGDLLHLLLAMVALVTSTGLRQRPNEKQ